MRRGMILLTVLALGLVIGGGTTLLYLALSRPNVDLPPAVAPGKSDIALTLDREFLVREANRRVGPTLQRYDLRDPEWRLGEDNTIVLDATGKLPVLGSDVDVSVLSSLAVEDGVVRVKVETVDYGLIEVSGDQLSGLAEDLNKELADAIDRRMFRVEHVETLPNAIVLRVKVVGDL